MTRVSGRWNLAGVPVVYTAATASLAVLEVLVHVDPDLVPHDLLLIEVQIPDDIKRLTWPPGDLPRGWRGSPAPRSLQQRGSRWLKDRETAILQVPSAIIPHEDNYLINPVHEEAARIEVLHREPFSFDPRLF